MSKPPLTEEAFRGALPASLCHHITSSQIEMMMCAGWFRADSINGCTLEEVMSAKPLLRDIGVAAIPCYRSGSLHLVAVDFVKL